MKVPNLYNNYKELRGSYKAATTDIGTSAVNGDLVIEITLILSRRQLIGDTIVSGKTLSRSEFAQIYGTSEENIEIIKAFAAHFGLKVIKINIASRSVTLRGTISNFENAFRVKLQNYTNSGGETYRGRSGYIHIPSALANIVQGVFGLDDRPHAMAKLRMHQHSGVFGSSTAKGYTPLEVANLYGFPKDVNGAGQCIGIVELAGGYRSNDLSQYFSKLGLPTPSVTEVCVAGGHNSPSILKSSDSEVMLDIEVAGAVAPGAKIVVYFGANADRGFLEAIAAAVHDDVNKPSVISISWGAPESHWTKQSLDNFNEILKEAAVLGVTVLVAAGDSGSSDGIKDGKVHVDFPTSSPWVLACGGTKLVAANNKIMSETVWNESVNAAGGGGVSDYFSLPDYQQNANVPLSVSTQFKGRGIPDISGNADPETGYKVLIDGQDVVIGGTSAVAPLYAGLIALLNQKIGKSAGFINPLLYANPSFCRDIIQGNNITTKTFQGYKAGANWDSCTGLGILMKLND